MNEQIMDEVVQLLRQSSRKNFEVAEANFKVGEIISTLCAEQGEEAIQDVAKALNGHGIPVQVPFLFDTYRVYQSIKKIDTLHAIKKNLGGNLRWNFLVHKCTKAPQGDTEETRIYWEQELTQIESAFKRVEKVAGLVEGLPDSVRSQVEGVLSTIGYDSSSQSGTDTSIKKIVHIGDEHFEAGELLAEIIKSADFIVERTRELKPDLIISSGDMLDSRQLHDSAALRAATKFVKQLANIAPVFILKGTTTHDGLSVSHFEGLETRHKVFVSETLQMVGVKAGEFYVMDEYQPGFDAIIYSVPPATKASIIATGVGMQEASGTVTEILRGVFSAWGAYSELARKKGVTTIVSCHGTVSGSMTSTGQKMIGRDIEVTLEDLLSIKADVCCLAHIHKAQAWEEAGVYYCGSIAKLDVGEVEDKLFWVHSLTESGRKSSPIIIPTKDIISVSFAGIPNIDELPEIKEGSLVRICYKVSEENVHIVDEATLKAKILEMGAGEVRLEKAVIPKQMVRAAGISSMNMLIDKVRKWAETTATQVTDSIAEKASILENPRDMVFLTLKLPLPSKKARR